MNWKALILVLVAVALGYAFYNAVMLYLSGAPLTLESFITQISAQSTFAIEFAMGKWQWIVGSIGSIITGIGLAYRTVKSKITSIQQSAESQVTEAQTIASTQYKQLQSDIDTLTQKNEALTTQLQAQADMQQDYATLETRFTQVNEQCKTQQSTIITYERMGNIDYVKKLQEALRVNNIPLPPYEGNTVTVVR